MTRPRCTFAVVPVAVLDLAAADVNEAPRTRLVRLGEVKAAIDGQCALPDPPRGHAPLPPSAHPAERQERTLVEFRELRARRYRRVGRTIPPTTAV
jgi:hypothetical protein